MQYADQFSSINYYFGLPFAWSLSSCTVDFFQSSILSCKGRTRQSIKELKSIKVKQLFIVTRHHDASFLYAISLFAKLCYALLNSSVWCMSLVSTCDIVMHKTPSFPFLSLEMPNHSLVSNAQRRSNNF